MKLQSAIHFLFPPQCLNCGIETDADFALCSSCWRETPFLAGLLCDACGVPLPGEKSGETVHCDSCLVAPKPWGIGRASVIYDGAARRLVLALKHGDRQDLAPAMARWMAHAARDLPLEDALIVPVPLYWRRLFFRRYNQASLLADGIARLKHCDTCPDLLLRTRPTRVQTNMTREARYENQRDAFAVAPRHLATIRNRNILLVDDVMTSGATLSACAEACLTAGAAQVNVAVFARVARDP